jgi:hypothetical protein
MLDVDVVGPISYLTSIVGVVKGCQLAGRLFGQTCKRREMQKPRGHDIRKVRLLVLSILDVCAVCLSDKRYLTHP